MQLYELAHLLNFIYKWRDLVVNLFDQVFVVIMFRFLCYMQLAGGTASMQQLKERLEKDLLEV